jgi:hypothetical protein
MSVVTMTGARRAAPGEPDPELLAFAEEIVARVRAGKVVALGTVEVEQAGKVAVGFCHRDHYHQLNSGACRLMVRLSTVEAAG